MCSLDELKVEVGGIANQIDALEAELKNVSVGYETLVKVNDVFQDSMLTAVARTEKEEGNLYSLVGDLGKEISNIPDVISDKIDKCRKDQDSLNDKIYSKKTEALTMTTAGEVFARREDALTTKGLYGGLVAVCVVMTFIILLIDKIP